MASISKRDDFDLAGGFGVSGSSVMSATGSCGSVGGGIICLSSIFGMRRITARSWSTGDLLSCVHRGDVDVSRGIFFGRRFPKAPALPPFQRNIVNAIVL